LQRYYLSTILLAIYEHWTRKVFFFIKNVTKFEFMSLT
jgi:hypothetical protein